MLIHRLALSSGSGSIGLVASDLLRHALGVDAKVGGFGISMWLLLFLTNLSHTRL